MVLRKIKLQNWESPVAGQYNIDSIPHFILFGPDGKEIKRGGPDLFEELDKLMK
jgi:hypothetical protein